MILNFYNSKILDILSGANSDFDKLSSVGLSNYGESYDYFSIMHYENTEGILKFLFCAFSESFMT